MAEGGVPDDQAAWGVDALLQVATATAAEQSAHTQSDRAEEDWNALTNVLRQASVDRHPCVAALAGELVAGAPATRRNLIFDALISGIVHTRRP